MAQQYPEPPLHRKSRRTPKWAFFSTLLEAVKQFGGPNTRAVLVTHRKGGGLQSSPMSVVADDDGNILTATRARNAKAYNLARDPHATLCLFTERWPGPWMHVEGEAEIERLP